MKKNSPSPLRVQTVMLLLAHHRLSSLLTMMVRTLRNTQALALILFILCILVVMVGFEETAYSVVESTSSSVNICVVLNGTTEREVEVFTTAVVISATSLLPHRHQCMRASYLSMFSTVSDGTGGDFIYSSSTLTFPAGDNRILCTPFFVLSDEILEDNETVSLILNSTDNGVILRPRSTTVVIIDDDCKSLVYYNFYFNVFITYSFIVVRLGFNSSNYIVMEPMEVAVVCVELTGEIERDVVVDVFTPSQSAG